MKYLAEFLAEVENEDMEPRTRKTEETTGPEIKGTWSREPGEPRQPPSSLGYLGSRAVAPVKNIGAGRPAELATWPATWRQKWGVLANRLEAEGVRFPESEQRAFTIVAEELAQFEAQHGPVQRTVSTEPAPDDIWPIDPEPDDVTPTGSKRGPRDVRWGDRWLRHHGTWK